ncbi:hypothetical protein ACIRQF_06520 [Streptomyces sp. NPDC101191]|uniref:hypothetical protein n=1 Tax=Streptomyces sp. NPDC101191 TaxID=3366126 RepID=UPI003807DF5D
MDQEAGVSREDLLKGVQVFFPHAVDSPEGIVSLESSRRKNEIFAYLISDGEITEVMQELNSARNADLSRVEWATSGEFTVIQIGNAYGLLDRIGEDNAFVLEGEGSLRYVFGKPSRAYAAHLLCEIGRRGGIPGSVARRSMVRRRMEMRAFPSAGTAKAVHEGGKGASFLDAFAAILSNTLTIQGVHSKVDFETLANSFLFQLAYNYDAPSRLGVDPVIEPPHIQRMRHRVGEMDAPRQLYDTELVHHYLLGVGAEIPLLEYLSFYHIVEHFFEKVFNDDLVEQVRKVIVDPSFSVRRSKDIQGVVKKVNSLQRQVREDGGVNEQRALELVLERFVDFDRLLADLDSYASPLVDYYREYGVPFAGADKVDLRSEDKRKLRRDLAKRVYKVRNALVHAKEGSLPKYAPFAHDAELRKEIPLMRFVAEQVVIGHGSI